MAAPKTRSHTDSVDMNRRIARLDRMGWEQFDIAHEVGISQPMVSMRLKKMRVWYLEEIKKDRELVVGEKVSQFRDVRREAWLAYFRSMEDAHKVVEEFASEQEQAGADDYVTSERLVKRVVTSEGRLPENAYLVTIMKTLDAERELLGLDEYKGPSTVINVQQTTINMFDAIAQLVACPVVDTIEQTIKQIGADPALKEAVME